MLGYSDGYRFTWSWQASVWDTCVKTQQCQSACVKLGLHHNLCEVTSRQCQTVWNYNTLFAKLHHDSTRLCEVTSHYLWSNITTGPVCVKLHDNLCEVTSRQYQTVWRYITLFVKFHHDRASLCEVTSESVWSNITTVWSYDTICVK